MVTTNQISQLADYGADFSAIDPRNLREKKRSQASDNHVLQRSNIVERKSSKNAKLAKGPTNSN